MDCLGDIIATVFAHTLRQYGISSIAISKKVLSTIPLSFRRCGGSILHYLVNAMILGKAKICFENVRGTLLGFYKGIDILSPTRDGYLSDAVAMKSDEDCSNGIASDIVHRLKSMIPKTPTLIIDLSLWELHHEKEKSSLVKQLIVAVDVVRKWLTDFHIVFSSAPSEVLSRLRRFMPIAIISYTTDEIYSMLSPSHTLLLDPYASDGLTNSDIFRYDFYVIGGIADRLYPRPYATYMLYKMHHLSMPRKSIKLGGSIVGVPNEIDKVINIILSARLGGLPLDKAVVRNMGIDDKIARILYEAKKYFGSQKSIDLECLKTLMNAYELSEKYMTKILAKIRYSK